MAKINCRMEPRSIPAPQPVRIAEVATLPRLHLRLRLLHNPGAPPRAVPEDPRNESVAAVHSAAGRHHPPDGRRPSVGWVAFRQLPISALPQVDYPTIQVQTF